MVRHGIGSAPAPAIETKPLTENEPTLPRMDEEGNVIGLSGLSEMMRDHPANEPDSKTVPSMPKAARREPGPKPAADSGPKLARYHAREADRKRRRKSMYLLLGVMVGSVAVLGGGLILASRMAKDTLDKTAVAPETQGPGADPRVIADDAPMLHAHRMDRPQWAFINRPFVETVGDPDIRLSQESIATAPDGSRTYLARAMTDRRDLLTEARVLLSLVDLSGTEVARTQAGLTLLDADHPRDIRIPIAERFKDPRLQPVARVESQRREPESVFLAQSDLQLTPIGSGRRSAVHITALNPLDKTLDGLTLQITAVDRQERPIARWRVRWDQPIEPQQRMEFQTLTPLADEASAHDWHVEAAGR